MDPKNSFEEKRKAFLASRAEKKSNSEVESRNDRMAAFMNMKGRSLAKSSPPTNSDHSPNAASLPQNNSTSIPSKQSTTSDDDTKPTNSTTTTSVEPTHNSSQPTPLLHSDAPSNHANKKNSNNNNNSNSNSETDESEKQSVEAKKDSAENGDVNNECTKVEKESARDDAPKARGVQAMRGKNAFMMMDRKAAMMSGGMKLLGDKRKDNHDLQLVSSDDAKGGSSSSSSACSSAPTLLLSSTSSTSSNQLFIDKEEIVGYVLDEVVRIYYQLYREQEEVKTNQCYITREATLLLRQIAFEVVNNLNEENFKEHSFTIPDPAALKAKHQLKINEQKENYKMQSLYKKLALDPSFLSIDENEHNPNHHHHPHPHPHPHHPNQITSSVSSPPPPHSCDENDANQNNNESKQEITKAEDENINTAEEKKTNGEVEEVKEETNVPLRGRKAMLMRGGSGGASGRANKRGSGIGGTSQRLSKSSARPILTRDGVVSNIDDVPSITFSRHLIDSESLIPLLTQKIQTQFPSFAVPASLSDSSSCSSSSASSKFEFFSYTVRGPRAANEDELVVIEHASSLISPHHSSSQYSFVGVYDGHSGKKASLYSRSQIHYNVFNHPQFEIDAQKAIHDGFIMTDSRFTDIQQRERLSCGTTALSVWIRDDGEITVSNVGDCRGYIYQNQTPLEICSPHTLQREDEKERILSSGGGVACVYGTWRVNGTIAVTRSIGDLNIKYLLIPDPEITCFKSNCRDDEYLIIASDGLWDVMTFHEVSQFVKQHPNRQIICKLLCEEALTRKSKDNVTIVIVYFNKSPDHT